MSSAQVLRNLDSLSIQPCELGELPLLSLGQRRKSGAIRSLRVWAAAAPVLSPDFAERGNTRQPSQRIASSTGCAGSCRKSTSVV
jgi:hypothetical protein